MVPPAFAKCKTCTDVPVFDFPGTNVGGVNILADFDVYIRTVFDRLSAKILWSFPTCFEPQNKTSNQFTFKNQLADVLDPEMVCS